jgi:hypothetical protein
MVKLLQLKQLPFPDKLSGAKTVVRSGLFLVSSNYEVQTWSRPARDPGETLV